MPDHYFNSVESIVNAHNHFQFTGKKDSVTYKGQKYSYVGHVTPHKLGFLRSFGNTLKIVYLSIRVLMIVSAHVHRESLKKTWSETFGIKTKKISVYLLDNQVISQQKIDECLSGHSKNPPSQPSSEVNPQPNNVKHASPPLAAKKEDKKPEKRLPTSPSSAVSSSSKKQSKHPSPNELTPEKITFFKNFGGVTENCGIAENARYHFYGCRDSEDPSKHLNDSGWGCAWRSLQTIASCLPFEKEPMKDIYESYRSPEQVLNAYTRAYPHKDLSDDEEEAILDAAPSRHRNWAEPFIGQLYLHDKGIQSSLLLYGRVPGAMNAPRFVFPETVVTSFSEFGQTLVNHFKTQRCPIMLDDGIFAFAMVGAKESKNHFHFLVADPHTTQGGDHGLFIVSLDKTTGKQDHHTCSKDRTQYTGTMSAINFQNKGWMILLPKLNNDN